MTTDPVSAISNPIIGDATARAVTPPLAAETSPAAPRDGAVAQEDGNGNGTMAGLAGRITAKARDFPAVNTPLIETIRAQIEEGRGQPDSNSIAEKLIELERLLRGA